MNNKNENKGGWNIWHVLIYCFFAIGTPTFLKYQANILGPNEKYIYSSYSFPVNIENISMILGFATFFIVFILSIILSPLLRKLFYKSVAKRYSNEKIIYFYYPLVNFMHWVTACVGGFIGCYIVPFFIYPSLNHIDMVTRDNMLFYSIFIFFLLASCIGFQYCAIVLTNKRIAKVISFVLQDIVEISLNNIKNTSNEGKLFVVYSKNNGRIVLTPSSKAKECQKKLIELLNKGKIND